MSYLSLEDIERIINRILPEIPYESGRVQLYKGWNTVYFRSRFVSTPAVVCTLEGDFSGWISKPFFNKISVYLDRVSIPSIAIPPTPKVEIPEIKVPSLPSITIPETPKVSIKKIELKWFKCDACGYANLYLIPPSNCPECGGVMHETDARDAMEGVYWFAARKAFGDWGAFNWMRDSIIYVFSFVGRYVGTVIETVISGLKQQVDEVVNGSEKALNDAMVNVKDKVEEAFEDFIYKIKSKDEDLYSKYAGSLEDAIENVKTKIISNVVSGLTIHVNKLNNVIEQIRSNIEEKVNKAIYDSETSVSLAIDKLYDELLRQEKGKIMIVPKLRNVNRMGFEVYSPINGAILNYVALGIKYG